MTVFVVYKIDALPGSCEIVVGVYDSMNRAHSAIESYTGRWGYTLSAKSTDPLLPRTLRGSKREYDASMWVVAHTINSKY